MLEALIKQSNILPQISMELDLSYKIWREMGTGCDAFSLRTSFNKVSPATTPVHELALLFSEA